MWRQSTSANSGWNLLLVLSLRNLSFLLYPLKILQGFQSVCAKFKKKQGQTFLCLKTGFIVTFICNSTYIKHKQTVEEQNWLLIAKCYRIWQVSKLKFSESEWTSKQTHTSHHTVIEDSLKRHTILDILYQQALAIGLNTFLYKQK